MNLQRVGRWLKSANGILVAAEIRAERGLLVVRQLQELVEQAELVHDLERRGMDGVAAKVAQEVGVLLEHDDVDAGAREQEAEHHAGRAAADDAATGRDLFGCHSSPFPIGVTVKLRHASSEHRPALESDHPLAHHVAGRAAATPKPRITTAAPTSMPRIASMP